MADFARQGVNVAELLAPAELEGLIQCKGLLAQWESGELLVDDEDLGPSSLPPDSPGARRYRFSDMCIVRFLRGRKLDQHKAFRALVRHLKWRADNDVSSITASAVMAESQQRKIVVHGKDLEGRPTIYIFASRHKTNDRDINIMQKFIIKTLEDTMKLTKPTDEKLVIVFDLSGFSMSCMDYEVVKMLVNILQWNYPEVLQVALVVNAPMIFSACWLVIRPWLDPVTAAKVTFLKKDEVSRYIPQTEMPPDFLDQQKFDDEEEDDEGDDEEERGTDRKA